MFSLFGIQALACKKINNYAQAQIFLDDQYFFKEGYLVVYIYQSDVDRIRSFMFDQLNKNENYLLGLHTKTIDGFKKFISKYNEFKKEIEEINNTGELKSWISSFIDIASDINTPAYMAELFAGYDNFWLDYFNLNKEDFEVLIAPEELSYSKEFSHDLARIKLRVPNIDSRKIAEKYFWILNNYKVVDVVTTDYISKELEKMSIDDAEKLLLDDGIYIPDLLNKKQIILNKIGLGLTKEKILKILSSFIVLQDKRKEVISKTNSIFLKACNKLLNTYGIIDNERQMIMFAAFPTWFSELGKEDLRKKSSEAYICHYYPLVGDDVIGLSALEILNKIESDDSFSGGTSIITGKIAYRGKVIGKVRKIIKSDDFDLFINGEILVTHMTRPEFVPVIKKASAIITDEGGITCHAAIVARELKKPCIIGTKIATQVLKDGDVVEVDADKGIIRIIK